MRKLIRFDKRSTAIQKAWVFVDPERFEEVTGHTIEEFTEDAENWLDDACTQVLNGYLDAECIDVKLSDHIEYSDDEADWSDFTVTDVPDVPKLVRLDSLKSGERFDYLGTEAVVAVPFNLDPSWVVVRIPTGTEVLLRGTTLVWKAES